MRYLAALAALALLALAAWVSIGSHGDGWSTPRAGLDLDNLRRDDLRISNPQLAGLHSLSVGGTPDRRLVGHQADIEKVEVAEASSSVVVTSKIDAVTSWLYPSTQEVGENEQYVRCTKFLCEGDSTGVYCPWGRPMASGIQVFPGAAACHPARMYQSFDLPSGVRFECLDTGDMVGWGNVDIWCYDAWHWGAPGTAYYEAPCPPCADYTVIEWLARE